MTELHRALLRNDLEAARRVLADGAPVNLPDSLGCPALQYVQGKDAMLARLLEHGADVNLPADDGTTPLMSADTRICFRKSGSQGQPVCLG